MLRTWLTEAFGLTAPIVGAPMVGAAGIELAGAVSAAGGLGMVGVGSTTGTDEVEATSARLRDAGAPFGVGLLAWALADRPELLESALAARPALVSISFGDVEPAIRRTRTAGIPVATQVGTPDEARRAADAGADVVVARGAEGGGHGRDALGTLTLLQLVLDAVDVPVLAAGGIASPRGLAAVLAAGAAGAWVGTALVATTQSAMHPDAKARVVAASATDTVVTRAFDVAQGLLWPPDLPGRALRNTFTDRWDGQQERLAGDPATRSAMLRARQAGDFDIAPVYSGQATGLVTGRRDAGDVVRWMAAGAEERLRSSG